MKFLVSFVLFTELRACRIATNPRPDDQNIVRMLAEIKYTDVVDFDISDITDLTAGIMLPGRKRSRFSTRSYVDKGKKFRRLSNRIRKGNADRIINNVACAAKAER